MCKTMRLPPCPICGQRLELELYDKVRDEEGSELEDYWVVNGHTEYGCVLDRFFDSLPESFDYDAATSFAIEWERFATEWKQQTQVRCGHCKWFQFGATPNDDELPHFCRLHGSDIVNEWGSCSYGERG